MRAHLTPFLNSLKLFSFSRKITLLILSLIILTNLGWAQSSIEYEPMNIGVDVDDSIEVEVEDKSSHLFDRDRGSRGDVGSTRSHKSSFPKNGHGTETWSNGHRYVGNFANSQRNGLGTYTWLDGTKYVGNWTNNQRNGHGTLTWPDGTKYVGNWTNNQRNGHGTYTWANGDKYTGPFVNGERTGNGTSTWVNGNRYVGPHRNGKLHGRGTFTWANGNKYSGPYVNGKRTGKGTYTWANGDKYSGPFVNGERTGNGTSTWVDGDTYVGPHRNGKLHGRGTYKWANGDKYSGPFVNGERTGNGTLTKANGVILEGEFRKGKFINGMKIKPNGVNTRYFIENGIQKEEMVLDLSKLSPESRATLKELKERNDNIEILEKIIAFHPLAIVLSNYDNPVGAISNSGSIEVGDHFSIGSTDWVTIARTLRGIEVAKRKAFSKRCELEAYSQMKSKLDFEFWKKMSMVVTNLMVNQK